MFCNKLIKQTVISVLTSLLLCFNSCKDGRPKAVLLDFELNTHLQLIQDGKTGSARVRLRQHMVSRGETSQPLFLMGLSYHLDKQYSKAARWFSYSINAEGPSYPQAWHFIAWCHYYLGDSEQAKHSFEMYLKTDGDEPDSQFGLGLIAMEDGDFDLAASLFKKSIRSSLNEPNIQAKAKSRLADVYVAWGERERAILLYQEAVQQNPNLYEAWFRLAKALQRVNNIEASEKALEQFDIARNRVRPDLYKQTRFPE